MKRWCLVPKILEKAGKSLPSLRGTAIAFGVGGWQGDFSSGQISVQTCFHFYSWPPNGVLRSGTVLCNDHLLRILYQDMWSHNLFCEPSVRLGELRIWLVLVRLSQAPAPCKTSLCQTPLERWVSQAGTGLGEKMATFWRQECCRHMRRPWSIHLPQLTALVILLVIER